MNCPRCSSPQLEQPDDGRAPQFECGSVDFSDYFFERPSCRVIQLENAIKAHRSQKADDRCIEDDDRLYEALGDGIKCDRRVGSKEEMKHNCHRFIENRCEGGGWPSYAQLELMLFKCGCHAPDCNSKGYSNKEYGVSLAPDESDCTCGWTAIRAQLWPEENKAT